VCKAVKAGSADVGATYASEAADPKNVKVDGCGAEAGDFRVLASTGNVPNEVVAARSDFPPTRINDVLAAFGRMGNTPEGKQVLTDAFRVDGWGVAVEGDFESVLDVVRAQGTKARVAPPQKQDKPEQPAKGGKPGKK
jgi:ABC-type phosphate/phosphonate transport system substrate-binding protein